MERFEQFDAYLRDEMDDRERLEFKQKLENDPAFRNDFLKHQKLVESLRQYERKQLKNKLLQLSPREHKSKSKTLWVSILAVAASVSILIILTLFVHRVESPQIAQNQQSFVEQYYTPPVNYYSPAERNGLNDSKLGQAFKHYEMEEYSEAAVLFDQLSGAIRNDPNLHYYVACCYLAARQNLKAEKLFEELLKADTYFVDSVRWNLALIYLDNGKKHKAKKMLHMLMQSDTYQAQAEKLINELDKK